MAGIYKGYDIRGIVPQDLNDETAYKIGVAFASLNKPKEVIIANDMRKNGISLKAQLILGLTSMGVNVVDMGLATTPMFYYAAKNYDAGLIITASHNPAEYNGCKMCLRGAKALTYESGIKKIEEFVNNWGEEAIKKQQETLEPGTIIQRDYLEEFMNFSLSFLEITKPVNLIMDAGNGMSSLTYNELERKTNLIKIEKMFFERDGSFPNHEANPMKEEALTEIQKRIKENPGKYKLGIVTDGDGDRCVFVDEKGEAIRADYITAIIAEKLLKKNPGRTILYDLRSSNSVREHIQEKGGKPLMTRVGHSYIKEIMLKENALFGGELVGHFYPLETNTTENTLYCLFQILNLLEEKKVTLSSLVNPLRKYSYSGEINTKVESDEKALVVLNKLKTKYSKGKLIEIDGVRIDYEDFWFSVRKSNTEPVIRLIVEAKTEEIMEEKRDEILEIIRR